MHRRRCRRRRRGRFCCAFLKKHSASRSAAGGAVESAAADAGGARRLREDFAPGVPPPGPRPSGPVEGTGAGDASPVTGAQTVEWTHRAGRVTG